MISVITGDIIKSRTVSPKTWLPILKSALTYLETDKELWEIYRGDSFQLELSDIKTVFLSCIYLKACIKTQQGLDVRLAIGIGEKTYEGQDVTESNGEAFQYSGDIMESLKKEKINLKLKSDQPEFDKQFNLMFKLSSIAMDNWTVNSAEIVKLAIERPNDSQEELGRSININQTAVSRRQQRAYLDSILELDTYFRQQTQQLIT